MGNLAFSQDAQFYNPALDGVKQMNEAIALAKKDNKNVLIQVGGNWCPWCVRFHHLCQDVFKIDSIIKKDYIYIPLNYSKENKNEQALEKLDFPQRFGFPVLVILDKNGKRIHTQDSGLLEKDKGYDTTKVVHFLENWTPQAIDAKTYQK
jgi:thioredoxin-related protein